MTDILPLHVAAVTLPEWHPEGPGPCDVYAYVIRSEGFVVLVDTGVGGGNPTIEKLYQPQDADLARILDAHGIQVGEIDAVVNSHLHFDHCGNNRLFPGVPIYVQRLELKAAQQEHYTISEWVDFEEANYVPLQGAFSLTDHISLVPTPGHTPGHQSVCVATSLGNQIVVAQAAYTEREFQAAQTPEFSAPSSNSYDDLRYVESLRDLIRLGPSRAFFSHDDVVWRPKERSSVGSESSGNESLDGAD